MNEEIFLIVKLIIIPVAIVLLFCEFQAFHLLKSNHSKVYQEMCAPDVFNNNSINSFRLMKFFFKREYKKLNDNTFTLLCDFILILQFVFLTLLSMFLYMLIDSAF